MDSGNSGSMQSSSGDEEFDSRAESISAFLNNNNNPLSHVGPMSNPPPPQPPPPPDHHHHHHPSSSSMFDPLSNYFDPLSSSRAPPPLTNPNSLLNLDVVWSKSLRSEPNCTDLGGFVAPSSPTQQFFTNQTQSRTTFPSMQIPQGSESGTRGSGSGPGLVSGSNDQTTNNNNTSSSSGNMARNPKKRSRASRRAPTTVLTTDTTNFRAMVQEFTGIPAPPFTSSPFPRSRLDLFGTASTLRSAATHLDPAPPPYLLRPFAQKIQPPPPPFVSPSLSSASTSFSTSSLVDAIASSTTTNINSGTGTNTTTNSSTSINYQLPSSDHLGLLKQPQNLLNINVQNPILNFHPLLQPPPKFPLSNSAILGSTKPQQAGSLDMVSNDSHLKMGVLEEFGLSHGHVNTNLTGLQSIVSSSDTTLRRTDNNPANWGGDGVGSNEGDHHPSLLRSINGNYNNSSQRATTNGKVNYSASSSDFHGDKGPENVATRSEGMMESWICSSD